MLNFNPFLISGSFLLNFSEGPLARKNARVFLPEEIDFNVGLYYKDKMKTILLISPLLIILLLVWFNRDRIAKFSSRESLYLALLLCLLYIPALFDWRMNEKFQKLRDRLSHQHE